jgi:tRNA(Ser,Leu) C12 N-acetylase TAN1
MKVEDPAALLAAVEQRTEESPALYDAISRVAPAMRTFQFHSVEEFKEKVAPILLEWAVRLTGRAFHVRLHRRGDKRELSTQELERVLDDALLDATTAASLPGKISFTDPDAVIAIDTIDDRAGMALWMRDDLAHHRLLRPD